RCDWLGVRKDVAGKRVAIDGLTVGHTAVAATPGRQVVLASWGYLVVLARPDAREAGALAVHLTKAHAGLPAGTILLVRFARRAPRKAAAPKTAPAVKSPHGESKHRQRPHTALHVKKQKTTKRRERHVPKAHLGDEPLKVTPHLGVTGYDFPVAGPTSYGD